MRHGDQEAVRAWLRNIKGIGQWLADLSWCAAWGGCSKCTWRPIRALKSG